MGEEGLNSQTAPANDAGGSKTGGETFPALIVGIGAGAGALKSLEALLAGIPTGVGVAAILIHHPELTQGDLVDQLKDRTAFTVVEATDGTTVWADRIYLVPPDKFLNIVGDQLTLKAPVHCNSLLMPIDHFFCSLAADRKNRCAGIVLSGNSSDGTLGLSDIRAAGGRTFAEDPAGAEAPAMPQSAIVAGEADEVLTIAAMAAAITALAKQTFATASQGTEGSQEFDADLRAVLDILRVQVGHDFRCYKPSTLARRIHRRMALAGTETMDAYTRHLAEHPDEVALLQKDLLIGVTDFFRQPPAWETLEKKVIAPLLESAPPGSDIRVWVPGCSLGKEVYSLAMLLAEQVEKSGRKAGFQIFATDADAAALAKARMGSYPEEEIGGNVSPERLKRFFSRKEGQYQVIKSIRERVVFAPQNITSDPPFSRLDLIICRNLLIYLDQQVQKKIIALFHFALRDGGFLFLGNAETIGDREDLFEPVSKKWRIYRRIGVGHRVTAEIPVRPAGDTIPALLRSPTAAAAPRMSLTSMAQQVLLDRFAPACVMIDRKLQVLYVHGMVENYLTLPAGELTTRVVDMAREGLRARLRGEIGKCIETGRPVTFTARARRGEKSVPVKVTVSSLRHIRESDGLLLLTFEDQRFPITKAGRQTKAEADVHQLADELKITREELQSTIDQLESSNDQLKASNEEVMAANEELQSANEEMETSKEELQSLNEELNTINVRLQEKVDELETATNDVVNLLASTSIATLFLDKQFRIKRYTPAVNRLMSLIPSDIGRPLGDIQLRVHDEALLDDARQVLVDLTPVTKEVRAEDGRWYIRRIMPYRTQDDRIEGVVVTFVDITDLKQAEADLRTAHTRAAWLARFPDENPVPVMRTSMDSTVLYCNAASAENPDWACKEGNTVPDPVRPLVALAMGKGEQIQRDIPLGARTYAITVVPFPTETYVNIYGRDITKRKQVEESLRRSEEALRRLNAELEERVASQTGEILRACEAAKTERQRFYDVLEMLPAYVVLLTPDYHAPFANKFFRERFGEAHGKRCFEFLFQRTEPCDICETYSVLKTGKPHRWDWIGPDGRNYDVHDFPFTDSDGASLILEMGIDVTDMKQAEAALREANEKLELRVAERTAELEGFNYTVSHDLRAPLRAIDGYTRMILKKHADQLDDDARDKFNTIRDNARMMGQLIDDLLAFSRASRAELSLSDLDVGDLVREIWEELTKSHPDRRLTLKLSELPPAQGDRALMRQVLTNLLANAVKFTQGRTETLIEVSGQAAKGENIYSVQDNGVGFDMQYHDKMFGVFHRLHNDDEFEGTGVGLAIVQRIVQRHGGRVWAEGEIDKGACFHFSLPA